MTTDVAPGAPMGGKYRLLRQLGEGGMGVVFEAEHVRLGQRVAIKFLRDDVLAMPDAVERFEREARATCRIHGPHVAQVLDVDADERGRPYIVMELLKGRDLEAELQERGALRVEEAVDWVLQACAAVADAHAAGIVHRDLKPSNLFLADHQGTRVLKVLDFGISKIACEDRSDALTSVGLTVGTPLYMSPEQVRCSRDVDARTDVWSLGVILYELVAGVPPFMGTTTAAIAAIVADATPSLREARPGVPAGLERAVATALAKCPAHRFPSVEAFGAALMPFASAQGIAGPFSLRPSREAFDVATNTMRRVPRGPRARESSDLLRLPTSGLGRAPSPVRTFVTTLAIGAGLASSVVLVGERSRAAPAAAVVARAALPGESASVGHATETETETEPPPAASSMSGAPQTARAPSLQPTTMVVRFPRRVFSSSGIAPSPHGAPSALATRKRRL
ncbi:MAG TPA: serine/threonine-protein kinase [Polyangiaceae bacterium]